MVSANTAQVAVFQTVRIIQLTHAVGQVQKVFKDVEQVIGRYLLALVIQTHLLVESSSAQFAERIFSLVGQFQQCGHTAAGATATVRFPRTTNDSQSFSLGDVFPLNASCFQKAVSISFRERLRQRPSPKAMFEQKPMNASAI